MLRRHMQQMHGMEMDNDRCYLSFEQEILSGLGHMGSIGYPIDSKGIPEDGQAIMRTLRFDANGKERQEISFSLL